MLDLSYTGNRNGLISFIRTEVDEDEFQTMDKRRSEADEADRVELENLENY